MAKHFVKAYDWVVRSGALTAFEKAVYLNLLSRQGTNRGAWPSHKTIANESGMSVSSARRAIESLKNHGLLKVEKQFAANAKQTSNLYHVMAYDHWPKGTPPLLTENDKGDSVQENSRELKDRVQGPRSKRRNWGNLKTTRPPTVKQIELLAELIAEESGCTLEEAFLTARSYEFDDQISAHDAIREMYGYVLTVRTQKLQDAPSS